MKKVVIIGASIGGASLAMLLSRGAEVSVYELKPRAEVGKKLCSNICTEPLKDVKFKGKIIRADFEGLSKKDLALLRRSGKKIYVKYGIPFVPVFLIAFILTVFFGDIIYFIIKLYGF